MKFTEEQIELINEAYDCIKKVVEDVPFETEGLDAELLWKAFMALASLEQR